MKKIFIVPICALALFNACREPKPVFLNPNYNGDDLDTIEIPVERNPTFKANNVEFKMILIEPGTFLMGSDKETDKDFNDDEGIDGKKHEITISKKFYIAETEVTQALWTAVMGNNENPSLNQTKGDSIIIDPQKYPVENVSFEDITKGGGFLDRLNVFTKMNNKAQKFRLPTEAEWEFVCRAGTNTLNYLGDELPSIENHEFFDLYEWSAYNAEGSTQPVKSKRPNPWGVYDMMGNVREWCADWYDVYDPVVKRNPTGPIYAPMEEKRVARGATILSADAFFYRCSTRNSYKETEKFPYLGFRLCLDAEEE